MSSEFGTNIRMTVFGESHGAGIGCVIDSFPAGEAIDLDELAAFTARRAPSGAVFSTARREPDAVSFLSGVTNGRTNGFPLCLTIENKDARPSDYSALKNVPRPSHADYTAAVKYSGKADMSGGGHFSGRLTAPLCAAGGIAKQILARRGVTVGAHILSVGRASDARFPLTGLTAEQLASPGKKLFPVFDEKNEEALLNEIKAAAEASDSVGGVVECAVLGLPAGIGGPMTGGVESALAYALFGVPAVKGVEFGSGFKGSGLRGSENNDPFTVSDGKIETETNNAGGILGGITTGMPLILRCAFKPTPSVALPQRSVDLVTKEETELSVRGRHDPCVAVRGVAVVEAVTAFTVLDLLTASDQKT